MLSNLDNSTLHSRVKSLINLEFTMVLATMDKLVSVPWSATVYFVYINGAFYFLSSPKSRHINEAIESNIAAVSIFSRVKFWSDIRGIQMLGNVVKINSLKVAGKVMRKYFAKCGLDNDLFPSITLNYLTIQNFLEKFTVQLYSFRPSQIIYSDNHFGFGFKKEVSLD